MELNLKLIIGIDPGKNGGIAFWYDNNIEAYSMPETVKDIRKLIIDYTRIYEQNQVKAWIENVHSMPGDGTASAFKFGRSFGQIETVIEMLNIPLQYVAPISWMKIYGSMPKAGKGASPAQKSKAKTERKNHIKQLAQQLYPNTHCTLKTADAILIAEYGRRIA